MLKSLARLDAEITRTLELARVKFPKHCFPTPKVRMDITGKCAGIFHWYQDGETLLRFNLELFLDNKEDFIKNTVPHEVAHFVTWVISPRSRPHGDVWRAIMQLFGISNPQARHNYEVAPVVRRPTPFTYRCPCKTHLFTKLRHGYAQKGVEYKCRDCGQPVVYVPPRRDAGGQSFTSQCETFNKKGEIK